MTGRAHSRTLLHLTSNLAIAPPCSGGTDLSEASTSLLTATYYLLVPTDLPPLTLASLKATATAYSKLLSETPVPALYGVTDGKAVGTYVEAAFNSHISTRFAHDQGNAAKGIDFPGLGVDLKVTSVKQPQSSSPFRDATQKVYGLGYHLLVFVYAKTDDAELQSARLDVRHLTFVEKELTADFQTTTGICRILDSEGNVDDIDAFLQERNLPLDDVGRRTLAERIMVERPQVGCLTISNALQWRLQYGRAIAIASEGSSPGVQNLNG
jgi:restriction system protein